MKNLLKNLNLYVAVFACLLFSVGLFGQDGAPAAAQDSSAGAAQGAAPAAKAKSAHQLEVERYEALHPTLPLGSTAPDFSVVDTNGKKHTLAEFKKSPILAIVFTCTHCPYAQMYEDRIQKLYEDYSAKNVAFIAVNPNAALAASPTELAWTDVDDSYQNMAIRQKLRHLTYPYYYDGFTQAMALAYGPKTTPHIFLFDKDRKLQYEGRIDDNLVEASVKTQDARAALDEMLAGQPVAEPHAPPFGCSTKWADQIEAKQKLLKDWQAKPIVIEPASADVLKGLRANPTGKVLLVTFWSTKCSRCAAEFPDLITSYLWYKTRPFDMVTVSTDGPAAQADVQKFLEDQHSAVRNLQFSSADVASLQQAFAGKTWDTHEPYTVLIDINGTVLYEHMGSEDNVLRIRRTTLANMHTVGQYHGFDQLWANNLKLEDEEEAKK